MSSLSINPSGSASNVPSRPGNPVPQETIAPAPAIDGPEGSTISTVAIQEISTKKISDFIAHNVQLLRTRTITASGPVPVIIAAVYASHPAEAEFYEVVLPPDSFLLDSESVDGLCFDLYHVIRQLYGWSSTGPRFSIEIAAPCSLSTAKTTLTAANLSNLFPVDGRGMFPADVSSWLSHLLHGFLWPDERQTVETLTSICREIVGFLYDRVPGAIHTLSSPAASPSPIFTTVLNVDGKKSAFGFHQRRVLQMLWLYTLICHTPGNAIAREQVGPSQAEDYLSYLTGVLAHIVEGKPVGTFVPSFLVDDDACTDPQRERPMYTRHRRRLVRAIEDISADTTAVKLLFNLEVVVPTVMEGGRVGTWRAGPLVHFTINENEQPSSVHYVYSPATLASNFDLIRLASDYSHLAANFNDIYWRNVSERTNARFYLGKYEGDVTALIHHCAVTRETWDITGAAVKAWLWADLVIQIEGIQRVNPHWKYESTLTADFPRLVLFENTWHTHEDALAEMRRILTTHPADSVLVIKRDYVSWDFISVAVCVQQSWPPSLPGAHHVLTTSPASELFDHLIPKAAAVRVPASNKNPVIVVINSSLYNKMRPASHTHHHIDVTWTDWDRCSHWPMSSLVCVTEAIREFAVDQLYTEHFVAAREVAILASYGPEICRNRDGRNLLSPTTVLTTDNITLPQPLFRPALAKYFSTAYNSVMRMPHVDLDAMCRVDVYEHAYGVVAQAAIHMVAAQNFHYVTEYSPIFADLRRNTRFHRPELNRFTFAVITGARMITEDDFGFVIDNPTEYWYQIQKQSTAISGSAIPLSTACRVRLFASPRGTAQRNIRDLFERAILTVDEVIPFVDPDAILAICYKVPNSWPLVMADTKFAICRYIYQESNQTTVFHTARPAPHRRHLMARNDATIPAARYFSCIMHLKFIHLDNYPDAGGADHIDAVSRSVRVQYWRWQRGQGPRIPKIDLQRTYSLTAAVAIEFYAKVRSDDKRLVASYMLGQFVETVPLTIPHVLALRVTQFHETPFGQRCLRARTVVRDQTVE